MTDLQYVIPSLNVETNTRSLDRGDFPRYRLPGVDMNCLQILPGNKGRFQTITICNADLVKFHTESTHEQRHTRATKYSRCSGDALAQNVSCFVASSSPLVMARYSKRTRTTATNHHASNTQFRSRTSSANTEEEFLVVESFLSRSIVVMVYVEW